MSPRLNRLERPPPLWPSNMATQPTPCGPSAVAACPESRASPQCICRRLALWNCEEPPGEHHTRQKPLPTPRTHTRVCHHCPSCSSWHQTAHAKHPLVLPHTIKDNRRTLSNGLIITERPSTGWPNIILSTTISRTWTMPSVMHGLTAQGPNCLPALGDRGPRHFLISGIRKSAEEALLYLNTLTTEGSVFFFIPFTTIKSAYIGTIEDLWLAKTMKSAHKVNEMVRVSILGNNHLLDFIRSRLPGDTTDAANTVVLTISVEAIEVKTNSTTTAVMWNVYCDPPPLTLADYQEGHFHTERPFHCWAAHSMDHPTGLCPFPLIAGWLGPAPTSDLAEDTTVLGPTGFWK
ncbi:hypothetical protein BJ912DRAFT_1068212 [Pholiota molesta]|nr:hypothetical protein BJ912DRAFT_1068212 [Pholiota molesta]